MIWWFSGWQQAIVKWKLNELTRITLSWWWKAEAVAEKRDSIDWEPWGCGGNETASAWPSAATGSLETMPNDSGGAAQIWSASLSRHLGALWSHAVCRTRQGSRSAETLLLLQGTEHGTRSQGLKAQTSIMLEFFHVMSFKPKESSDPSAWKKVSSWLFTIVPSI